MAGRHLLRRLSPVMRNASLRHLPAIRPVLQVCQFRETLVRQTGVAPLTSVRCMSTNTALEIINIQDEKDFQKHVMESEKPVVVDFHATWCGPCKLLGPRLETILAEEKGRVVMAKVDIDENMDLAMQYQVQSVPTVYGFKDGKVHNRFIGLKEDEEIKSFVQGLR